VRDSWVKIKLGDISSLQGGSQPPKNTFIYEPSDGYIRLLQIRDFKSDDKAVYIPIDKKNKICKEEDILIGRYGASVGKICTGKAGAYNVALMKATSDERLTRKYYLYYLKSELFQKKLISVSARGAQNGFNKEGIYNFEVPVPPIEEQKEIVEILDKAFESIDKAKANIEKNIENAKELFKSKLNQIFSQTGDDWKEHALNDVCQKITQGPNPKLRNDIPSENNFILKTKDFYNHKIYYQKCDRISDSLIKEWERFTLEEDDFIIGLVGVGSIGKSNLFKNQKGKKFIFTRATGLIRTNKELLNPQFLRFFFLSGLGISMINKGIGGTTGQLVIKTSYLKSLKINIPKSIDIQNKIIEEINTVDNHIQSLLLIYEEELKNLEELKKSIHLKAFNGELTNKNKAA